MLKAAYNLLMGTTPAFFYQVMEFSTWFSKESWTTKWKAFIEAS